MSTLTKVVTCVYISERSMGIYSTVWEFGEQYKAIPDNNFLCLRNHLVNMGWVLSGNKNDQLYVYI